MVTLKALGRRIRCWLRIGLSGSKLERIQHDDVKYIKEVMNLVEANPVENQSWLRVVNDWPDFEAADATLSSLTIRVRNSIREVNEGALLPVHHPHKEWVNAQYYYSVRERHYVDVQKNLERFLKAVRALLELYSKLERTEDVRAKLNYERLKPLVEEVRSVLSRWIYSQV